MFQQASCHLKGFFIRGLQEYFTSSAKKNPEAGNFLAETYVGALKYHLYMPFS
jgi:hypothetical protein